MPKILLVSLLITLTFTLSPNQASAATDPINATVSATATVPSTTATTSDTTAPTPVILVSPTDNTITGANRPELVWKQTSDPNGNTVFYTVYLNGIAEYLGVSNTGNSQKNNYISRISDNQVLLNPSHDLSDGTYTWMVAAYDLSGNTSYSTTWHFTVDTTPPPLTLINIDDQYQNPTVVESSNFNLPGPQIVTLTFKTEPYLTFTLTYTLPDLSSLTVTTQADSNGLVVTNLDLPLRITQIIATSIDPALHTTTLPLFQLTLSSTPLSGGISLTKLISPLNLSNIITQIPSLPATVAKIGTRVSPAVFIYTMLALGLLILLIIIWKHQYNILILDKNTKTPFRSLIVYHSRPTHTARFAQTIGRIFITNRPPILYEVNKTGQLYIHHLGRYSSLTIRTPDGNTHILSLSVQAKRYQVII